MLMKVYLKKLKLLQQQLPAKVMKKMTVK